VLVIQRKIGVEMMTVENDAIVSVRMPKTLRKALELKRQSMSRAAGAEVKESAVIRAILERNLKPFLRRGRAT